MARCGVPGTQRGWSGDRRRRNYWRRAHMPPRQAGQRTRRRSCVRIRPRRVECGTRHHWVLHTRVPEQVETRYFDTYEVLSLRLCTHTCMHNPTTHETTPLRTERVGSVPGVVAHAPPRSGLFTNISRRENPALRNCIFSMFANPGYPTRDDS